MRNLFLTFIFLLTSAICYSQGFNLGQAHHRAHMLGMTNGIIPIDSVQKWKSEIPENYRQFARQSGTMSNSWNLDSTGYNHIQHNIQLRNQRIPQPTQSYIPAFLKWLEDWKYDSLVWTLNTHLHFLLQKEGKQKESEYFKEQMFDVLAKVNAIQPVTHICLENETYLDPRVIGMSGGAPTPADKSRYSGRALILAAFMPNPQFEQPIKNEIRAFYRYLEPIVERLRKEYPSAKIVISCDHPITMRGRWNLDVVREFPHLWDMIDVHLYPPTGNTRQTENWTNERLVGFAGLPIVVFEWNYHHDSGKPYANFYNDMERILKPYLHLRHTLWYQGSAFSFINP